MDSLFSIFLVIYYLFKARLVLFIRKVNILFKQTVEMTILNLLQRFSTFYNIPYLKTVLENYALNNNLRKRRPFKSFTT